MPLLKSILSQVYYASAGSRQLIISKDSFYMIIKLNSDQDKFYNMWVIITWIVLHCPFYFSNQDFLIDYYQYFTLNYVTTLHMHCVGTSANIDCDSKYNLVFPKCLYSCYFPGSYETPSTIFNCKSCFSLLISFELAHSLVVGSVSVLSVKCRMACTKNSLSATKLVLLVSL